MNILKQYGLSDRFETEAKMYPEFELARITQQHRGLYTVITEKGEMTAEITGKFRFENSNLIDFPTVGDFVMVTISSDSKSAVIHRILTRKSVFVRTAVGVSGQVQSIASNIDTVFICMSLNNNFNLSRLERYLCVAWDSGATPVVVLTKSDLCDNLSAMTAQVERVSCYSNIVNVSMYENNAGDKMSAYLRAGTTSVFIGSSGVGKSTLINNIMGGNLLATADIGKLDKGRHTTTGREMLVSPFGGVIIDTPGMRELGVDSADISKTFDDIEKLANECRFTDCTHTGEPGCAVIEALENGSLDKRRFENYMKIKNEAGYEGLNSKQIEVKKLERIAKDIGGMKNMRRYAQQKNRNKF